LKRIRDFVTGKVRRMEAEHLLAVEVEGEADPELGAHEAALVGPRGSLRFFAEGVRLSTGLALPYRDLAELHLEGPEDAPVAVRAVLRDGATVRVSGSPAGATVLFATLRWVGSALLRRRLVG
jgi:hypothetical protein